MFSPFPSVLDTNKRPRTLVSVVRPIKIELGRQLAFKLPMKLSLPRRGLALDFDLNRFSGKPLILQFSFTFTFVTQAEKPCRASDEVPSENMALFPYLYFLSQNLWHRQRFTSWNC